MKRLLVLGLLALAACDVSPGEYAEHKVTPPRYTPAVWVDSVRHVACYETSAMVYGGESVAISCVKL